MNTEFNSRVCEYSKFKYKMNTELNSRVREYSKVKYKMNTEFNSRVREYPSIHFPSVGSWGGWSLSQRSSGERRGTPWTGRQSITGPHRDKRDKQPCTLTLSTKDNFFLLFRKQVVECKRQSYENKQPEVSVLAKRCMTLQYLHVCDINCQHGCPMSDSPSSKLWICYTCHHKILAGKLPEESVPTTCTWMKYQQN